MKILKTSRTYLRDKIKLVILRVNIIVNSLVTREQDQCMLRMCFSLVGTIRSIRSTVYSKHTAYQFCGKIYNHDCVNFNHNDIFKA